MVGVVFALYILLDDSCKKSSCKTEQEGLKHDAIGMIFYDWLTDSKWNARSVFSILSPAGSNKNLSYNSE